MSSNQDDYSKDGFQKETIRLSAQALAKETFLKHYNKAPPTATEEEQQLLFESRLTVKEKFARKILCKFFIPVGKGRLLVGTCTCPKSRDKFFFKPSKVKGDLGEYHVRAELCDQTVKAMRKNIGQLEAHFWLNNPSQIDYSKNGRDMILDARELANSHHRFVQKNLLEQDMYLYIVLALVAMIVGIIGLGYGLTKTPEQTSIYTAPDGTQYIFQNNKLIAQGQNIAPLPSAVGEIIKSQTEAQKEDR